MDLIFLNIITLFGLLYIFNELTSCLILDKANTRSCKNNILFVKTYKGRYRGRKKNEGSQQKAWRINSKLVSSFESPIVGVTIGNILKNKNKNKNKNKYLFFSQNSVINPSIPKDALSISLKLEKELYLGRNKSLVNNLLCLHYVPTISNSYLKKSLNDFRLSDLNIKENILYHLTLKCLYSYEQNTRDKNVLETIQQNNYKFILQHSKTLKKITKQVQVSEEKKRFNFSTNFNNLKNNMVTTQSDNSWVENKIVDVYLKNRKKLNIIFINTKKKKNIFQTYKKIIRNIKYYDMFDRLIILNYLYINKKYRECLLFFKKYIYNNIFTHTNQQKSKYFIINFINILNENNILNLYLMKIQHSHDFFFKSILLPTINDKYKLNFLSINPYNFIQANLKDTLYLGINQQNDVENNQNENLQNCRLSIHNNPKITPLFYINILNTFLKKKNYYFPELFLKQFYSHYMNNINDYNIASDDKWIFFLITLAFSLKIFYIKSKGNVTSYSKEMAEKCKESYFIDSSLNGQVEPLETAPYTHFQNYNRVNIFDEDLFSSDITNLAAAFEIVNKIVNVSKLNDGMDIYNHFYILLLMQYMYLLQFNLKNSNLNIDREKYQATLLALEDIKMDNLFSKIIKGYKKILNKKITTHPNEEIIIYNQAFEELNFFIENYLTNITDKNIKNEKEQTYILPEILENLMHILSMRKISISFFFSLLHFLDLNNNNKQLLSICFKKKQVFKNINKNIKKLIIKRFLNGTQTSKQHEQTRFLFDYILLEYKEIYETYKSITICSNKTDMKKLISKLTKANKSEHNMKIFTNPILALNLKQLFFIFYSLSNLKMDKEIVSLFKHAIKTKCLKKKKFINIFKNNDEEKENHTHPKNSSSIEENTNLYKQIFLIYHNSLLSIDNSFYNPKSNKSGLNYSKYFFSYSNNPLHIYKYITNKYEGDLKEEQAYSPIKLHKNCNEYVNKIDEELEKIENIQFFGINNIERIKKSAIFKKFFIDKIYNFIDKNDYTLILNGLMKYLLKNVTTLRASQIGEKWETSEKKKKKKKKLWTKYVYLYFYLTGQCYLKTHKMSNINFLILLKTSLLMNDINNFNNLLLLNKELTHKNYMLINSMINSDPNVLSSNLKQSYIPILTKYLTVPTDMYIIHNEKLIIYNLNYFQVTKIIDNFINVETQIMFFIDYRQTFIDLINLDNFFNLSFFKNNKFIQFLNHHNLILNENNFFKNSKFVLFFGNCINKKNKIIKYFSTHYKDYSIRENKNIKDALIISVRN
ncbi:conserved Plasmodium protein, unknown function [Plasmodium chabaudi chabaudi]|uniref:Uncharacterized protein n=1 Tax=Plasmodium chabaudi chabaudi TaxID=31271 RepID=A0A1C6YJQ2_PLACU|nr:conserved Plasmodium protein, unknown function [Plasmodium chabaudi chabaudi]